MTTIQLTKGQSTTIDTSKLKLVSTRKWYFNLMGYAVSSQRVGKKTSKIWLHRFLTNCPLDKQVDHINGDRLDNRLKNLRVCTRSQNYMNRRLVGGSSKYKGVSKHQNGWIAYIKKDNKRKYLGYFKDEVTAAKTYDKNAKAMFGDFARLNFNK